jgi:hypothetical protein
MLPRDHFVSRILSIIILFVISYLYCRRINCWIKTKRCFITLTLHKRIDIPGWGFHFHSFAAWHLNLTRWRSNNFLRETLKAHNYRRLPHPWMFQNSTFRSACLNVDFCLSQCFGRGGEGEDDSVQLPLPSMNRLSQNEPGTFFCVLWDFRLFFNVYFLATLKFIVPCGGRNVSSGTFSKIMLYFQTLKVVQYDICVKCL